MMDFDLQLSNSFSSDASSTFTLDFPITGGVNLDATAPQQLTMLLDANRLLRFFNQGRTDQGPNPGLPANRSYFFTTVFERSVFAFVGTPGSIRGYSWATRACTQATTIPSDHQCTDNPFVVAGWLTLVFDKDGTPLLASAMPDDDNTLTVIKGANMTRTGYDTTAVTSSETSWNARVSLGESDKATLFNVPKTLDVGSESVEGYFEGMQKSYGTVRYKRGL